MKELRHGHVKFSSVFLRLALGRLCEVRGVHGEIELVRAGGDKALWLSVTGSDHLLSFTTRPPAISDQA